MILHKETFKKFGYYPDKLGVWSRLTIIYKCIVCKKAIVCSNVNYFQKKTKRCQPCSTKDLKGPRTSLANKKIGHLLVLSKTRNRGRKLQRLTLCDCGQKTFIDTSNLTRMTQKYCGRKCKLKVSSLRKGYKELTGSFFSSMQRNAKVRDLSFKVSAKYIYEILINQNKRCALSGVEIILSGWFSDRNKNNASLDRIDSSKGYTKDNVQWVHKDINFMKSNKSDKEFINLCKQVAKYNK